MDGQFYIDAYNVHSHECGKCHRKKTEEICEYCGYDPRRPGYSRCSDYGKYRLLRMFPTNCQEKENPATGDTFVDDPDSTAIVLGDAPGSSHSRSDDEGAGEGGSDGIENLFECTDCGSYDIMTAIELLFHQCVLAKPNNMCARCIGCNARMSQSTAETHKCSANKVTHSPWRPRERVMSTHSSVWSEAETREHGLAIVLNHVAQEDRMRVAEFDTFTDGSPVPLRTMPRDVAKQDERVELCTSCGDTVDSRHICSSIAGRCGKIPLCVHCGADVSTGFNTHSCWRWRELAGTALGEHCGVPDKIRNVRCADCMRQFSIMVFLHHECTAHNIRVQCLKCSHTVALDLWTRHACADMMRLGVQQVRCIECFASVDIHNVYEHCTSTCTHAVLNDYWAHASSPSAVNGGQYRTQTPPARSIYSEYPDDATSYWNQSDSGSDFACSDDDGFTSYRAYGASNVLKFTCSHCRKKFAADEYHSCINMHADISATCTTCTEVCMTNTSIRWHQCLVP